MDCPDIVLDVDGVILDFSKCFAEYFNKAQDKIILPMEPKLWDYGFVGDELAYLRKYLNEYAESAPHIEIIDDKWTRLTEKLCDKYKVSIVTAYHHQESRKTNLEHYSIKYHDIHFATNINKAEYVAKLSPKIIVEDCPLHINKLVTLLPETKILVPARCIYSCQVVKHDNIILYDTLEDLERIIFDLLK